MLPARTRLCAADNIHKVDSERQVNNLKISGLTLLLVLVLAIASQQHQIVDMQSASVYYVATNGNDSNPGTLDRPFRTIQRGASVAQAGSTVYIRGGIYKEQVTISNSGTASAPIRIVAYPGETPVIDGDNYRLPTIQWAALLSITGNYVYLSGLEVRDSNWMGVAISGRHSTVSEINSHHNKENGILIKGDYSIAENSWVWWNCASNEYGITTRGGWASGLSAARYPNGAILRGNVVYHNWCEGLSTYEANGTIIEDNIVYDNHTNVYVSDATNVIVRRNLVYSTPGSVIDVDTPSNSRVGIMMGDERYNPPSSNITIANNMVYGNSKNIYWWQGTQGGGMKDVLIAYNTLVNAYGDAGIQINRGSHQNVHVINNIVHQDNSVPVAVVVASNGLSFSHNLWSRNPPSSAAGPGDVIGDPQFTRVGIVAPGELQPDWFKVASSSPACGRAQVLEEVTEDFFRTVRSNMPTIGAYEYTDSPPVPPPPTPDHFTVQVYLPVIIRS